MDDDVTSFGDHCETVVAPYQLSHTPAITQIFFDSVRNGTKQHYTKEQRIAWAPNIPDTNEWQNRLQAQTTFVAFSNTELVGFMSLESDGNLDLAFVKPDKIGTGIGKALYKAIENAAAKQSISILRTEASHSARAFFTRQGWHTINEQSVQKADVKLTNFLMEKQIGPDPS